MPTEIIHFYVRCDRGADPIAMPRPRGRIMMQGGKPHVHIYHQLEAYEKLPNGRRGKRKAWDAAKWKERIIERARAAAVGVEGLPVEGPVRLDLDFYFGRPQHLLTPRSPIGQIPHDSRPDVDNLSKLVMDAITQAGWRPLERDGRIQKLEAVMRDENATTNERFSASRLITNLSRKLNRKGDVEKTPLIWSDDSQVADVKVQKFYLGKLEKATGVRVTVTRMQDPEPSLLAVNGNAMAGVMNV